jgi:hypothetical protein
MLCVRNGLQTVHIPRVAYYKVVGNHLEIRMETGALAYHWPQAGETCATREMVNG